MTFKVGDRMGDGNFSDYKKYPIAMACVVGLAEDLPPYREFSEAARTERSK